MVLDVLISVYNGVTDKVGTVTYLSNFLGSKRHIERIEALRAEKDEKRRSAMKKSLPAATVSGVFHPTRRADNLVKHSGFISIDIDGKENPGVSLDDMRTALICRPYVAYAAISVSGNGMFAIIPIARTDNEGHGAHFDALKEEFAQYGIKLDASCRDTSRLRFLSYDPEAYINENAEQFFGEAMEDMDLLYRMCRGRMISAEKIGWFVEKSAKRGNVEATAMLLEYRATALSAEEIAAARDELEHWDVE